MKHKYLTILGLAALAACASVPQTGTKATTSNDKLSAAARTLDMFRAGTSSHEQCYDRTTMGETFVVDAHNHFRPFGGTAKSMTEINQYLLDTGVLFVASGTEWFT